MNAPGAPRHSFLRHTSRLLSIACLLWSCLALPAVADDTKLKIGGTGTTLQTMRLLAAAFEKANPDLHVTVLSSLGSTGGIKAALADAIDVAVSARPLSDDERARGAVAIEYGRAPLVLAVARATGATTITTTQLLDIYAGKPVLWPDGDQVRVILRPAADVNTLILKGLSSQMAAAITAAEKRPGMLFALTDQEALEHLEKVPGALVSTSLNEVVARAPLVMALKLDGKDPTPAALADGSYPLFHTFFLVRGKTPSAPATKFVEFVLSEPGRKILAATGHLLSRTNPS